MPKSLHCLPALVAALVLCGERPAVAAGEPVNREAPELTLEGGTLTTSDGTWVGRTQPYRYAWYRCTGTTLPSCAAIPGEGGNTYSLRSADGGHRIRSRVTASNQVGSSSAFSAPTAVVARTPVTPGRATPPPRLTPFPVFVIAGRSRGRLTRLTDVVVRGPRGARVSLRCRGTRCPLGRVTTRIGAARRVRLRSAQRVYRAGQALELRVTAPNRIGKFVRVRFRRGRAPARADSCLLPGRTQPSSCLTS
jgi:hypothetical protein